MIPGPARPEPSLADSEHCSRGRLHRGLAFLSPWKCVDVNFYALNPKRMIKLEECVGANPQGRLWGGSESFRVLGETSEVALPSLNRTSCGFQRGLRGREGRPPRSRIDNVPLGLKKPGRGSWRDVRGEPAEQGRPLGAAPDKSHLQTHPRAAGHRRLGTHACGNHPRDTLFHRGW